jgi:hypothetical protein
VTIVVDARQQIQDAVDRLGVEIVAYLLWYGESAVNRVLAAVDDDVIGRLEDFERHFAGRDMVRDPRFGPPSRP